MINYSIIIPHKNIPSLLQRCLDSIPLRNDVQVIVVDDNSDPGIVDFGNFPGKERPDTTLIFTKEGKGAGYARNIGLEHADGDWIIFMDSDDLFSSNFGSILDSIKESKSDIIYYDYETVMSNDIRIKSKRDSSFHRHIQNFLSDEDCDEYNLRFRFYPLWGKIVNSNLIQRHSIKFSETKWSNDLAFSCKIGLYAKEIEVYGTPLYIATQRTGSLTSNFCGTKEEFTVRFNEALKNERFLVSKGVRLRETESKRILRLVFRQYGKRTYMSYWFSQKLFSYSFRSMFLFLSAVLKDKLSKKGSK